MLKKEAQAVAGEIGVSLSALIKAYLKQLVKTKRAELTAEEPSAYLIKSLKEVEKEVKQGKVSPVFHNADDAIKWLDDPKARLQNGDKV